MWIFLSAIVLCLTIIVLFRMYIDLKRVDNQHVRMLKSDQRNHDRYVAVSSRPTVTPALPDFGRAAKVRQATRPVEAWLERQRAEEAIDKSIRYWEIDEAPAAPSPEQIEHLTRLEFERWKRTL